jgi:DNA-binding beta-propeller fold protein YncE
MYPQKITAHPLTRQIAIADTGHHRVLVSSPLSAGADDARVLRIACVAGCGEAGQKDGSFDSAQFHMPAGLTFDPSGKILYLADTENHQIRKIDLDKRLVTTVAGTGRKSAHYPPHPGKGIWCALNSPWDVLQIGNILHIAMAGSHQLWTLDLISKECRPFAGTGRESKDDGPRVQSSWSQPSGLSADGRWLYVADAEDSSIRKVSLEADGQVISIVGGHLFDFGDRDGVGEHARLQHPLAVLFHEGKLFVADSYNHKIRLVDPARNCIQGWAGTGAAGLRDGDPSAAEFSEPAGLALLDGRLLVADTNNHAVRVIEISSGNVATLDIRLDEISANVGTDP